MNTRFCYIIIMSFFASCIDHKDLNIEPVACGNVEGIVLDSILNIPVPNAFVGYGGFSSNTADNDGRFNFNFCQEFDIEGINGQPSGNDSSSRTLFAASSQYEKVGYTTIYWGDVKNEDTTITRDLKIKPVGLIKIHVKNVTNLSDSCLFINSWYCIPNGFSQKKFEGASIDTLIYLKEWPNDSVYLGWHIGCGYDYLSHDTTIYTPSGDTVSFDIFY